MKTRLFVLLMMAAVLLSACGVQSAIKGQWQQGNGEILEFADDGVLKFTSLGVTLTGSYEFVDDDTMQVAMDGLLGFTTLTYDVSIEGDTLTLTTNGISLTYTRIK
ncbi:MAG: hypothetical protein MUC85_05525 [Anaerolineales bacterium]|jgi:hypothetical protein|nr:hypothetical protein [Anaerolineales bacterium]